MTVHAVNIDDTAGIRLTEAAAAHIRRCIEQRGQGEGLRVTIKPSGCSGYAYALDFADHVDPQDLVINAHGARLIVDRDSVALMAGTEVDYISEGLNRLFKFNNPRAVDECGCGESFSVEANL